MALTEDNPIAGQLHAMKQRMEVLYSKNFKESSKEAEACSEPAGGRDLFQPPVDVWETKQEWLILMDLPGVDQQDFEIELTEARLVIRGRRKTAPVKEGTVAAPLERPEGAFSRSFVLPANIRAEAVTAKLKNGVLTVVISKSYNGH